MMSQKNIGLKIFVIPSIVLFLLLIFASFASADSKLVLSSNSPTSLTANHGTEIPVSFNLTNNAVIDYTSLVWSGTPAAIWKILPTLAFINSGVNNTLTATIIIPQYTAPSTFTATLTVKNGTDVSASLPFAITVTNSSSFSVEKVRDISRLDNGNIQGGQIKVFNTGNFDLSFTASKDASSAFDVSLDKTSFTLQPNTSLTLNIMNTTSLESLALGTSTAKINVAAGGITNSINVAYTKQFHFCSRGNAGTNLTISGITMNSPEDNENEWKKLDEITVSFDVNNKGTQDISGIYAQLGIFDGDWNNRVTYLLKLENGTEKIKKEIKLGTIDYSDLETATYNFKISPKFAAGSYRLIFKAYKSGLSEDELCAESTPRNIQITEEEDEEKYIAFENAKITPLDVTCGDRAILDLDVFNIGDSNQKRVKIILQNKELGIDTFTEIKDGLNRGKSKSLSFDIAVPENAANKNYDLELWSKYGYDSGDGSYETTSDDEFIVPLHVVGCVAKESPRTILIASAVLGSEAKAGSPLTVTAKITNIGTNTSLFAVGAKNYDSWATLDSISEKVFNLAQGESKNVNFVLNVKPDATGSKTFALEVASGDKTETKNIAVELAEERKTSGLFSDLKNNYMLWVIGAINLLLIILIIVVAVRLSRR